MILAPPIRDGQGPRPNLTLYSCLPSHDRGWEYQPPEYLDWECLRKESLRWESPGWGSPSWESPDEHRRELLMDLVIARSGDWQRLADILSKESDTP